MNAIQAPVSALIENISDFVVVIDAFGVVQFASASIESIGGYTADEVVGTRFSDYIHREDMQKALDALGKVLADPDHVGLCECRFRHKRGHWRVLQALGRNRGSVPGIEGIVVTARDVTELRETELRRQRTDEQLRRSLLDSVRALAAAVEARDQYTAGHQRRVADLSVTIARRVGFSADRELGLMLAASIHDVGKLRVPIDILTKPGNLTALEYSLVQTHVSASHDIVGHIDFPWPIAQIVAQHHERLDGSGYPQQLQGAQILMEARIIAVADTVESMTNQRPYRRGLGIDAALAEIQRGRGDVYDAGAVDICVDLIRNHGYSIHDH